MKFYAHKMTSISVIDAKFRKNPLFHLRDFQFFLTAVTNLLPILPAIPSVFGDFFTFQQDSAPVHCTRDTVALLSAETPDLSAYWIQVDWPPNSPDLSPVDYAIWGILQERVYRCQIRDVDHLKERLIEEWRRFDQNIIDRAVNQWRDRLHKMCTRERGTLRTSDRPINMLTVLTDINCAENS